MVFLIIGLALKEKHHITFGSGQRTLNAKRAKNKEQTLENPVFVTCPKDWIAFGSQCLYFAEDMGNWTFSQTFCTTLEASLAQFERQEELNFLKRDNGLSDYWIGLKREASYHIWKWTENTECKAWFSIKEFGACAYLNDNGISNVRNYTDNVVVCFPPHKNLN
uniref:C-type lectin domain family 2 member H-like n=1 Tax=Ictidomys tridecemlineatus TaxID=43179 RepID=UPI001A9D89B8|nr:C-type lectin domain family 2 member H-like [Ictidomys tridecemlineatus]